jgi:Skp family chaperone for outer membrane proteins
MMRLAVGLGFVVGWLVLGPGAVTAQVSIAAIDMGAVFEAHPLFLNQLEVLKQEIRQFEEEQNRQREGLQAKFQLLRGQDPGSEAYRQGEAEIANQTASLDVQKKLRAKEFAQKEAKIYFDIYTDVSVHVASYCQHHGVSAVIHYNSRPMDLDNPATIMERMGSNVVYARPDWEITAAVKQLCGSKAAAAAGGAPVGGGQPRVNR